MRFALLCTDRDGVRRTFLCEVDEDNGAHEETWYGRVATPPRADDDLGMEFTLKEYDAATLMVLTIVTADDRYVGVGIRDALIPELASHLGKGICSSSREHPIYQWNEDRNDEGEKVWKRLEAAGRARYDRGLDRYFLH